MKKLTRAMISIALLMLFTFSIIGSVYANNGKNSGKESSEVSGKVMVLGKNQADATVILLKGGAIYKQTTTDSQGLYIIEDVAAGKYDLYASYECYEPATVKNVNIVKNRDYNKVINLNKFSCDDKPPQDTTPPVVEITDHPEITNTEVVTVTGKVDDIAAEVYVNGVKVALDGYFWTAEIVLSEGENIVEAYAVDINGNVSEIESVIIVLDTTAPVVAITSYPAIANYTAIEVIGTVDDDKATVYVDGIIASLTGNIWTAILNLAEGHHEVIAYAVNRLGTVSNPIIAEIEIDITAPDTFIDNVDINGTTVHVDFHGTESVYSVMLEGGEWSDWQDHRNFTFHDLDYGVYTVYVRSMDEAGNIDPTPASYTFTVQKNIMSMVVPTVLEGMQYRTGGGLFNRVGFLIQRNSGNVMTVAFMKFDQFAIPEGKTLESAKLVLTFNQQNIAGLNTHDEYEYAIRSMDSYWEIYPTVSGEPAHNYSSHKSEDVKAMMPISASEQKAYADLTDLVSSWIDGSSENYGIHIEASEFFAEDDDDGEYRKVSDHLYGIAIDNPEFRPHLLIEYY